MQLIHHYRYIVLYVVVMLRRTAAHRFTQQLVSNTPWLGVVKLYLIYTMTGVVLPYTAGVVLPYMAGVVLPYGWAFPTLYGAGLTSSTL